jgi:hypothetical protein
LNGLSLVFQFPFLVPGDVSIGFHFFIESCALAIHCFGTLSKISLSMGSGDADSGVGVETATGLGL